MTHAPPPAIRFLVAGDRALVVVDLAVARHPVQTGVGPAARPAPGSGAAHPLFDAFTAAGLPTIESTAPGDLVRTVGLAWTGDDTQVRLEATTPPPVAGGPPRDQARPLLRIRRSQVDRAWLDTAEAAGTVVVVAAIALGLQREDADRVVLHRVEQAISRGDLVGGRVDFRDESADEHDVRVTSGRSSAGRARPGPTPGPAVDTSDRENPPPRGLASASPGRMAALGVASLLVVAMVGQAMGGDDPGSVAPPRPTTAATATAPQASGAPIEAPAPLPATPASWVVAGDDGTPVSPDSQADVLEVAAAGLTWPILEEVDGGYRVSTHCDTEVWVDADDVVRPEVGRGDGLHGAVVVLDAGHGGVDAGAVGPNDLYEADLNLEVAERLQAMLERSNDIDPETGAVVAGEQVPPVAAVVMTRDRQDGKEGSQRTSLTFRGVLAAGADADALLSIHHNAGGTQTFEEPPTEVYYSVDDQESPRLAGLVLEELRRSLAPLDSVWGGTTLDGALGRQDPDGSDYYSVLEASEGAAVITEAMYMSGPRGAALAATEEFQQAEAEALYRALVRYLGTDETGLDVNEPALYDPGSSEPYDYSDCSLAAEEVPGP